MTVKELIKKLKSFDPDALVVVGGFDEGGYADIERFELLEVVPRESGAEIFGEYRGLEPKDKKKIKALLIDHD